MATCAIPGATTISSDLTGRSGMLRRSPAHSQVGRVGGAALPGIARRARGDRLGFVAVYAARDVAGDAAPLSFTKVTESRQRGRSEE
jgi:hypothetical protein